MITKEDLKTQLIAFMESAKAKGDLNDGIRAYLEYIRDNYKDLDDEAKKVGDNAFDAIGELAAETLATMPDSVQRRKLARLHAKAYGGHWDIRDIADALEKKTQLQEQVSKETNVLQETEDLFFEDTQLIADLIHDVISNAMKGPDLVLLTLYCSALDELIVSFHLAQHGYGPQSFAHQRAVYEIGDKIELFSTKQEYIDLWSSEDPKDQRKIRHELGASGVRKKLGKKAHDPIFSFLSEMGSHPTMKYIQSKVFMRKPKGETKREARIWVGGSPRVDSLVFTNTGLVQALMRVLISISQVYSQHFLAEENAEILRTSFEKYRAYMLKTFCGWLKQNGTDTSEMEEYMRNVKPL